MNFIKKIFQDKTDRAVHSQFVRFGKGEYRRRAIISLWKTKNIKIKSSFEFVNDFVLFVTNLDDSGKVVFNGNIRSKEPIESLSGGVKKQEKWIYNVNNLPSSKVKEIVDKAYYLLLNADGPGIKLRIKTKLPKPGKSEEKIDDKFCQLELDEKYYNTVKEDFFWDIPDCKKASIEHCFIIEEIISPKEEKDYAKIREFAKRKGKIVRIVNIDGKEIKTEKGFEV